MHVYALAKTRVDYELLKNNTVGRTAPTSPGLFNHQEIFDGVENSFLGKHSNLYQHETNFQTKKNYFYSES